MSLDDEIATRSLYEVRLKVESKGDGNGIYPLIEIGSLTEVSMKRRDRKSLVEK
ncbi:hypothetical protein Glove_59g78 [Diversispora epigaea]|uniref:Uncharacterized protein n=1 Tax=Diversispora epigaea TaxID=1348612 RepID=A0A397JCS1_9GLOM|nr:hypothetical protein Glove_59g78 [Diversispora epigaea]